MPTTTRNSRAAVDTLLGASKSSLFRWNAVAQRYQDIATGRFVTTVSVRMELDRLVDEASNRMAILSQRMVAGRLSLADWQLGMMQEIKTLHITYATAAHGGWEQMAPADWGRVGQKIAAQYDYLRNFANEVYTGKQPMTGVINRSTLYAEAARGTYESERRMLAEQAGFDQEKNTLGAADHCNGCVTETMKGWQPIMTLVAIGARNCKSRCRCHMDYRKAPSLGLGSDLSNTGEE